MRREVTVAGTLNNVYEELACINLWKECGYATLILVMVDACIHIREGRQNNHRMKDLLTHLQELGIRNNTMKSSKNSTTDSLITRPEPDPIRITASDVVGD